MALLAKFFLFFKNQMSFDKIIFVRNRVFVNILIFFVVGGAAVMGQNKAIDKNDLPAYLPKDVQGWTTAGEDQWFDPQTIFDYIDGGGEVYRAYNFQRLFVRRLKKVGQPDIIVDFFDMGSSRDAFGVFTHDLEGDDWGIGQGSTYKSGLLSFWRDRYFISLTAEAETPEAKQALTALGKHIAAVIGKDGAKPALLNFLPTGMASEKNVHYFHNHIILNYHFYVSDGNILNLDQTTEAILARMGEKGERSYMLVVGYADPKKASQAYAGFTKIYMPDAVEPGLVQTEDKKWTAARVKGRFLAVVFSASTAAEGKDLLARVEQKIKI
jgi:hypothetical protein